MSLAPKKSMRPKPRPKNFAEEIELREMVDRANRAADREGADLPENMKKMKAGGKVISEYGGKEKYASKKAMMRHERAESPAMEKAEKMKSGGMVRGTGAAIRGKGFSGCY